MKPYPSSIYPLNRPAIPLFACLFGRVSVPCGYMPQHEEFRVNGEDLLAKVKELIKAGTARRLILRNDQEETLLEIPLAVGAVGALLLPTLAAVGAIAALVTKCTIVVVKDTDSQS